MRHPLLQGSKDLRKRMTSLLSEGLSIRRTGNLLFVCGNNRPRGLRSRFRRFADKRLGDFNLFQPEFAMQNYFSDSEHDQLDLGEFEILVGSLSHVIVLFPEGAGSFAETGYFSLVPSLAKKTLLILDVEEQKNDSFIMMGPARRFEKDSKFAPNIQLDFKNPDFEQIAERIERYSSPKKLKFLNPLEIDEPYDLFCIIYKIVDLLNVATMEDILYVLHSITDGHAPKKRARDITSILIGAGYLNAVGDFGHYFPNRRFQSLVEVRVGFADKEAAIKFEILDLLEKSDAEFGELLKARANAN